MSGGAGGRVRSFWATSATVKGPLRASSSTAWAASALPTSAFFPPTLARSATKAGGSGPARVARSTQYSSGTKARRSFSRSTMSLRATDCTRPAEMPLLTFFHSSGETL